MKRPREIIITPVLNGYLIRVACQIVVFESKERLLCELNKYLTDPSTVEAEYLKDAINPTEESAPQCVANEGVGQRATINRLDPCPPPITPMAQEVRR